MKQVTNLYFIDNARGLAALLVTIFHYFGDIDNFFLDDTLLEKISAYAGEGVLIFFIVSGFVIPYSLFQKKYNIQDYPIFILKRKLRLDPPYFLSILFVVFYYLLISLANDLPFPFTVKQLALHIGYLNDFFKAEWVNVVYWSLAVEFQYYLLVGLLFPLLLYNSWLSFILFVILLILPSQLGSNKAWITHYVHFFAVGMMISFYYLKMQSNFQAILFALIVGIFTWVGVISVHDFCIILITIGLFILLKNFNKYLHFLGEISYSLYLTHTYTGLILIAFIRKKTDNMWLEYGVGGIALVVALICAYGFYLLIEKPSKKWAMSIKY